MDGIDRPSSGIRRFGSRQPAISPAVARRVLGLSAAELDPVQIILAAQIRLRRWRRCGGMPQAGTVGRVQRIVIARDTLLRGSVERSG